MSLRHRIRQFLWAAGYDLIHFRPESHPIARQRRLFADLGIDLVIDVGANVGQYARYLRSDLGYEGRIVSLEPLAAEFEALRGKAAGDRKWTCLRLALGDRPGQARINVSKNSYSSSFLPMLELHKRAAPESEFAREEAVSVTTLDHIFDTISDKAHSIYLKIDVQGFEERVLRGARRSLRKLRAVQMEMSLVPLYRGERTFAEHLEYMKRSGFRLASVEPGFADASSGQLLQADGIFLRV